MQPRILPKHTGQPSPTAAKTPGHTRQAFQRGLTLTELLTVIAIISILAAIIIPTVGLARQAARDAQCKSNLRQIGIACLLFSQDHKQQLPAGNDYVPTRTPARITWSQAIGPYLGEPDITKRAPVLMCPSGLPATTPQPQYSSNGDVIDDSANPVSLLSIDTSRSAEITLVLDGLIRKSFLPQSPQAQGVLTRAALGFSEAAPDQPIHDSNDKDGEGEDRAVSYRHGTDQANAVMVDGSVRSFKKGTLKGRNFLKNLQ